MAGSSADGVGAATSSGTATCKHKTSSKATHANIYVRTISYSCFGLPGFNVGRSYYLDCWGSKRRKDHPRRGHQRASFGGGGIRRGWQGGTGGGLVCCSDSGGGVGGCTAFPSTPGAGGNSRSRGHCCCSDCSDQSTQPDQSDHHDQSPHQSSSSAEAMITSYWDRLKVLRWSWP